MNFKLEPHELALFNNVLQFFVSQHGQRQDIVSLVNKINQQVNQQNSFIDLVENKTTGVWSTLNEAGSGK